MTEGQSQNDASPPGGGGGGNAADKGAAPSSTASSQPRPRGRPPSNSNAASNKTVAGGAVEAAGGAASRHVAAAGGGAAAPVHKKLAHHAALASATAPARKIARLPLNPYLRVAIIRDDKDVVVCDDPQNPGTKKEIAMGQMSEKGKRKDGENNDKSASEGAANAAEKKDEQPKDKGTGESNNDANKKEIPVPTITTVKRYDTDVPPDYDVPTSYVRHVCPTYEEVDEAIEYNLDAEDEKWWRDNADFGPHSKAKIMVGGEEQTDPKQSPVDDKIVQKEGVGKPKETAKPKAKRARGNKGKFVKKSSVKEITEVEDPKEEPAEVDETPGSAPGSEAKTPPSTPRHNYTAEQVLLLNPRYLHSRHSTMNLFRRYNPKLPLMLFEQMMDILEKATGFDIIPTVQQAEALLVEKMPKLVDIFGPLSAKDRRLEMEDDERYLRRWVKLERLEATQTKDGKPMPSFGPPITLPAVIQQVYNYWMAKRSKLKKPLLRRYWPPTAATDTNPHQVFRQRDKEKRRLRKKRQNDAEAYKKMRQLKMDFEKVGVLCELILSREGVNSTLVELTNDYFEERMHGFADTTGRPRRSELLTKSGVERVLNVTKYFEDGPIVKVKGGAGRKRKRSSQVGQWNADGRDPSPVPPVSGVVHGGPHPPAGAPMATLPPGMKPPPMTLVPPKNFEMAGIDGGLPAPNFLQPLATRESQPVEAYESSLPSMPAYINGKLTTQPNKFTHRPRLGRGGRILIDRVPCPSPAVFHNGHPGSLPPPPPTVVTYGTPMKRSGYHNATLGADGPRYSINSSPDKLGPNNIVGTGTDARTGPTAPPARSIEDLLPKSFEDPASISRRIEEICALGLMEDYAAQTHATAATASVASSKSGHTASSTVAGAALHEELDEVLVPIEDWMEAPAELKVYGSEEFVIGPL